MKTRQLIFLLILLFSIVLSSCQSMRQKRETRQTQIRLLKNNIRHTEARIVKINGLIMEVDSIIAREDSIQQTPDDN